MPRKYEMRQPARLSDILTAVLKGKGWDTMVREYRVFAVWNEAVGSHIARNTFPKRIDRGVLFVIVKSSVWVHELSLLKQDIIGRLNARLSEEIVRDIRFAQGEIPNQDKDLQPQRGQANRKADKRVDDYTRGIKDGELKEIIKKALAKALSEDRDT